MKQGIELSINRSTDSNIKADKNIFDLPKTCTLICFRSGTLKIFHQVFLPNPKSVTLVLFYLRPNYAIVITVTINAVDVDKSISFYLSV